MTTTCRYFDLPSIGFWNCLVRFLLLCDGFSSMNAQLTALPDIAPDITACPEDISVVAKFGESFAEVTWEEPQPLLDDVFLVYQSHVPGDIPIGRTNVTYTFRSLTGVDTSCTFRIEVLIADTEPPVVRNCPSSFAMDFTLGQSHITLRSWLEPTAEDNSGQFTVENNHEPGESIYVRRSTVVDVIYEFRDPSDNIGYCSFGIHLRAVDRTPPNVRCPRSMSVSVPLGVTGVFSAVEYPSATDDAGLVTMSVTPEIPSLFPLGMTLIEFSFSDLNQQSSSCQLVINVFAEDMTPPIITYCPSDISVGVRPGTQVASVQWDEPQAEDNSGPVFLASQSVSPGLFDVNNRATLVTYIFMDSRGNEAECVFQVQVFEDDVSPVIFGCPSSGITWFVRDGETSALVFWAEPVPVDDGGVRTRSQTHRPGDEFTLGNSTVTYTFEDSSSNSATCIFDVSVQTIQSRVEADSNYQIRNVVITCLAVLVVYFIVTLVVTVYCIRKDRRKAVSDPKRSPPVPVDGGDVTDRPSNEVAVGTWSDGASYVQPNEFSAGYASELPLDPTGYTQPFNEPGYMEMSNVIYERASVIPVDVGDEIKSDEKLQQ